MGDDVEKTKAASGDHGMKVKCLTCGSPQEGFFCGDCHSLLPIGSDLDYFSLLEMERRPRLDEEKLREMFIKCSQRVHPDRHYNAAEEIQAASLDQASLVNQAYKTLKNPRERLKYLVGLETGSEPRETSSVSMDILSFYMDASEVCHEVEAFGKSLVRGDRSPQGGEREALKKKVIDLKKQTQSRWLDALKQIDEIDREWMESGAGGRAEVLKKMGLLANDLSYLMKLQTLLDEQMLALSS